MGSFLQRVVNTALDTLKELVGDALLFVILAAVVILGSLPIYFILKKTGLPGRPPGKTTFREDLQEMLTAQPIRMEDLPPERRQFLQQLQTVESGVTTVYQYFLYTVIALVTGFVVYFFYTMPRDSNTAFLQVFFGIGYFMAMVWLIGLALAARKRRTEPRPSYAEADLVDGLRSILNVSVGTATPEIHTVDERSLHTAEIYLEGGGTLDDACALIDPKYRSWPPAIKQAFQQAVRTSLESRHKGAQHERTDPQAH